MYGNSKQTGNSRRTAVSDAMYVSGGNFLQDLFSVVVSLLQYFVLEAKFCNEAGIVECEICHCEI